MVLDISVETFQEAAKLIRKKHLRTPLRPLHFIKTDSGNDIFLKAENLQPSGSFKIRGATYSISQLSDEERKRGVVAYSTGNHAQAVALAAHLMGCKATIVMSEDVPKNKVDATREFGANVVMAEPTSKARQAMAESLAKEHGYSLVHPCDHPNTITGQGTIGIEILEKMTPAAIFVPIGGGGMISGIAMAVKKIQPEVKVIGVEPELENDAYQSFQAKKRIGLPGPSKSVADAIKIQILGEMPYEVVMKYVDDIVTVTEDQILDATQMTLDKAHLLVETSGALGLAAALHYKGHLDHNKPVVCIASGGNMLLSRLCQLTEGRK
ncbi:MAG: threonine/serine dehydratase [Parachlamydiales bacterium]|nr:threonine/serine dehydratase [Parachlamydiales bacterium]